MKIAARKQPLIGFAILLVVLLALRVLVGFMAIPTAAIAPASIAISVIFVGLPIFALYMGAEFPWRLPTALLCTAIGVVIQLGFSRLTGFAHAPLASGILLGISQGGLIVWCLGVGASIACLLKDKNLLLPIAIFLALFDIWLVFVPEGFVHKVINTDQRALGRIAYQVPAVTHVSAGGYAQPQIFVGPADLLFLAMFFTALFRFRMRTKETYLWMIPTLAAYLLVVLIYRDVSLGPIRLGALPALVPIGAVVLLVNRREFILTKDEKQTTLVLLVIGLILLSWRFKVSAENPPVESTPRIRGTRGPNSPPFQGPPDPRQMRILADPGA